MASAQRSANHQGEPLRFDWTGSGASFMHWHFLTRTQTFRHFLCSATAEFCGLGGVISQLSEQRHLHCGGVVRSGQTGGVRPRCAARFLASTETEVFWDETEDLVSDRQNRRRDGLRILPDRTAELSSAKRQL